MPNITYTNAIPMAVSVELIDALKRLLRGQGMTYRELAQRLKLSEAAVKRMFSLRAMSLQRRVMWFLLASAPLVWALGLAYGLRSASLEINELFDTQQLQLARQVLALLPSLPPALAERLACSKRSRTRAAPTPTNISTKSEPLME